MHRLPLASPSSVVPSASTKDGMTPKNGRVADPGFVGVTPAMGLIRTEPVSVCHQVSTTSHEELPTFSKYHCQTSGLIGSPTVPRISREFLELDSKYFSPAAISALIAVGAV